MTGLDERVNLETWCSAGLSLIIFPVEAEYSTLLKVLETFNGQVTFLIHSKPLREIKTENTIILDATGHALTAQTALRQRIKASDDDATLENPEDIHSILAQLQKQRRSHPDVQWWIWWSPSDLVTHDVDEKEVIRCIRALSNEFSGDRFLILVAKEVHSEQTLARLEYISEVTIDVTRDRTRGQIKHDWSVRKHPDVKIEGVTVVA